MGHEEVMGRGDRGSRVAPPGSVRADAVAMVRGDPRFIDGRDAPDPVAEPLRHDRGVIGERQGGGTGRPAARILERLREVPVVQGDDRLDAPLQEAVDEARVEVEAGLVHRTRGTRRSRTRP